MADRPIRRTIAIVALTFFLLILLVVSKSLWISPKTSPAAMNGAGVGPVFPVGSFADHRHQPKPFEGMTDGGPPPWLPPQEKPGVVQIAIALHGEDPGELTRWLESRQTKFVREMLRERMTAELRQRRSRLGLDGLTPAQTFDMIHRVASAAATVASDLTAVRRDVRLHDYCPDHPNHATIGIFLLGEIPHEKLLATAQEAIDKLPQGSPAKEARFAQAVRDAIEGLSVEYLASVDRYLARTYRGNPLSKGLDWPQPAEVSAETEVRRISTAAPFWSSVGMSFLFDDDSLIVSKKDSIQVWRTCEESASPEVVLPVKGFCNPRAIALTADRLFVGAPCAKDACGDGRSCNSGVVYVFRRQGDTLVEETRIVPTDARQVGGFGSSVTSDGKRLIVSGSAGPEQQKERPGAVSIYRRDGAKWTLETTLIGSLEDVDFGHPLALDGETLMVAATSYDGRGSRGPMNGSGKIRVYRCRDGQWTEGKPLRAHDADQGQQFGTTLALHGDILAVGVPRDFTARSGGGSVYVFQQDGEEWVIHDKLTAPDIRSEQEFGRRVVLSGDRLLVGANDIRDGIIYEFRRIGGYWEFSRRLSSQDPDLYEIGAGFAITDEWVIAGASRYLQRNSETIEFLFYPLDGTTAAP